MKTRILAFSVSILLGVSSLAMAREQSAFERPVREIVNDICAKLPMKEKPVLLVVPFQGIGGKVTSLGTYLSDELHIELSNHKVSVLERKSLDTLLGERKLSDLGLLDETTTVKFGRALGASYAIYGTAVTTTKVIAVNLKIVNIERGETIGGVSYDITRTRSIDNVISSFTDEERQVYVPPKTRYAIGLSAFGVAPTDSKQFGIGGGGGATFLYNMGQYFSFEAFGGYYAQPIKQYTLPKGDLGITAVQSGLRYHFLGEGIVNPYLSGGVGLYFISRQSHGGSNYQINLCPDKLYGCSGQLGTGKGYYGGLGVDFAVSDAISISLDSKYITADSHTGSGEGSDSKTFKIGGLMASTGFTYRY